MTASKIMIIRHGEKQSKDGVVIGITREGAPNSDELSVRGWQRSGALVRFFAPPDRKALAPNLDIPNVIFASIVSAQSSSLRPQHTVLGLSDFLRMPLNLAHSEGQEEDLAADAMAQNGTVLIAWEHKAIHLIANQIIGNDSTCPQKWPGKRFDVVWVFDAVTAGGWKFSQVPQLLLPGDLSNPISMSTTPEQQEEENDLV